MRPWGPWKGLKKLLSRQRYPTRSLPNFLHADLIYTSDVVLAPETNPTTSAVGTVERTVYKMEMVVRDLRQHVGGL